MSLKAGLLIGVLALGCAWLSQAQPLPAGDPAAQQTAAPVPVPTPSPEAIRYYRSGNVLWLVSTAWGLLLPALLLFSGLSARLRELARRIGRYWFCTLLIYFAGFALVLFTASAPLDYYVEFVRQHAYGLSSQSFGKWLHDELTGLGVGLILGALLLWIPYQLFKRAPQRWWLYTWLASIPVLLCFALVEPIWIEPLFNDFGPMQDRALETRILALAHRAGIDGADVYEVNKSVDTKELNAYVTGIGATKRIVLWDTIIRQLTPDELLMVMGHEMGHYVLGHVWRGLIFASLGLLAALWLLHRTVDWALRRCHARTRVGELADIASLPLIMLLLEMFGLVFQPVTLAFARQMEHEADRFGLEITRDNHACAMAFSKLVVQDLAYPTPGPLYRIWRSSHPPLGDRILFCNAYHPWLEGSAGRYDRYFRGAAEGGR